MTLSHRERLQACLKDDPALDRPPVALWRHFPVDDQEPALLAAAALDFQQRYDFDLLKLTPASSFAMRDWGAEDVWEGHSEGTRRYTRRVIREPQDWEKLPVLAPSAHHLNAQLDCLRTLRHSLDRETPLLQTVFSPLAQAKNLAGAELLLEHLHTHPQAVLKGLETIARTTRRFVEACLEEGVDGIFYAVQHAQADLLTWDEYCQFGLPFDHACLAPAQGCWCNLLHLHGLKVHFNEAAAAYPAGLFAIVNWHDRETSPSLAEGLILSPGAVCGGISQHTIALGDADQVRGQVEDALQQTGGRRFILGTGCVVPVIAPHGNLAAARQAVEASR